MLLCVALTYPDQELAERAVEQIQGVIHTLIRKGTTAALHAKVIVVISHIQCHGNALASGQVFTERLRHTES